MKKRSSSDSPSSRKVNRSDDKPEASVAKIKQLEKQAEMMWDVLLDSGLSDGHCKSYDPLTIEPMDGGGYDFLSYVFDHEDGGRSRYIRTLEEGQVWLLKSFRDWLDDERLEDLLYAEEVSNE